MRGTQATSALFNSIDKHFKQSKEQNLIIVWRTRSIPSSGSLLQQLIFCNIRWSGCIMLVCSVLRVDLWYCACMHACLFYAASRSTVLYTYACTHCTIMHPIPKHAWRAQSRVQRYRMLLNCASFAAQDVGSRNRTVMYMCDVYFAVQT